MSPRSPLAAHHCLACCPQVPADGGHHQGEGEEGGKVALGHTTGVKAGDQEPSSHIQSIFAAEATSLPSSKAAALLLVAAIGSQSPEFAPPLTFVITWFKRPRKVNNEVCETAHRSNCRCSPRTISQTPTAAATYHKDQHHLNTLTSSLSRLLRTYASPPVAASMATSTSSLVSLR